MLISKKLAQEIEGCIAKTHEAVTRGYDKHALLPIGSGMACFSGVDSFLSQVIGWGFTCEIGSFTQEIKAIEQFYLQQGHRQVDIELCPLAGSWVARQLSKRNYRVTELNNVSVMDLQNFKPVKQEIDVRPIQKSELSSWSRCVAHGFNGLEAESHFLHYASADSVTAFGTFIDGKLAAGGTIAIHEGICDLGVTSTLPLFRGKGLQKALLLARLNFARESGAWLATVTTEPGAISDLNIQKMGFHCAYTRIKFEHILDCIHS